MMKFSFQVGSTLLRYVDRGDLGAILEIGNLNDWDESTAILLPPDEVFELGKHLLAGTGQNIQKLPKKLILFLERIVGWSGTTIELQRGEKQAAKNALKMLKMIERDAKDGKTEERPKNNRYRPSVL